MSMIIDWLPWWVIPSLCAVALGLTVPYWWPLFMPLWAWTPKWIKVALGAVGAAVLAYFAGRNRGAKNERERKDEATRRAIETRNEVQNDVAKADAPTVDKRLDRWMRD